MRTGSWIRYEKQTDSKEIDDIKSKDSSNTFPSSNNPLFKNKFRSLVYIDEHTFYGDKHSSKSVESNSTSTPQLKHHWKQLVIDEETTIFKSNKSFMDIVVYVENTTYSKADWKELVLFDEEASTEPITTTTSQPNREDILVGSNNSMSILMYLLIAFIVLIFIGIVAFPFLELKLFRNAYAVQDL